MNAFFPYAGSSGKYARLIAEIIRREGFEIYAEPMIGSGAVFFNLAPRQAFICDAEWLHINLYKQARLNPEHVIDALGFVLPEKDWFLERQQTILHVGQDPVVVAADWYALLILCYNGVVKKKDGRPLLTWGDRYLTWNQRLPNYKQKIRVVSRMLQGTEIFAGDYELCPQADIAFFDPPWFDSGEDYGVDFDHQRLADYLKSYQGKWILTINDCEAARETYTPVSTSHYFLEPYYSVSPTTAGRFKRSELLLMNFRSPMFGG